MPSISLRKQPGMYLTHSGLVIVHDIPFQPSNLFKRYRHIPLSSFRPDNIYLYSGTFTFMNFWGNRTNLQVTNEYSTVPLKYADVFFNRFDNNIPLVCVLKFHNKKDGKTVQDRIYSHSRDGYLIDGNWNTPITTLSTFLQDDEKELLDLLLKESNTVLKTITYELDKINTEQREIKYNSDKITLSTKQNVRSYSLNEFHKYTHTPNDRRNKKSFILYNNNAPMVDNNTFLSNIQQEPHDSITVYFSNELDTPLVIESIKNGKKSHFQRINSDGTKWISNNIDDYTEQKLINYLGTVYRFVKVKKLEEQRRQELELEKQREKERERSRDQVSGPGSESEQVIQRTEGQRPQTTPVIQDSREPIISSSEHVQSDEQATYSHQPKSTLTCNMCVLINKQTDYQKSEVVEKTCKPEKPGETETQPLDVQPTKISVLPFDLRDVVRNKTGYKYYIHDMKPNLESLKKQTQDKNIVIVLNIYISNFELSLFDTKGVKTKLIYNMGMSVNSLYVYFYEHNTKPQKTDTVPLMLYFNGYFYEPSGRDTYFSGWNRINGIQGTSNKFEIKKRLDAINKELNKIELDFKNGSNSSYGLPNLGSIKIQKFETERVKVTVHKKKNYTRVIHRTINSFTIGSIMYGNEDIANGGIKIKGTTGGGGLSTAITVDKHNHTKFVTTGNNNPNTVVAYYHKDDGGFKLPQLIVLMNTDDIINEDQTITASPSSKYGYYVLATNGGGKYKYEWRSVENPDKTPFQLDDSTEFSLLNGVVILVDKQTQYQEHEISQAVTSATTVRSPGNLSGVNRLKHKTINIPKETSQILSGDPGKCVSQYGYKLYSHDITGLVEWTGSSGQPSIPLIGGFRFLIPSSTRSDGYEEISLYSNDKTSGPGDLLYHTPKKINNSNQNKIYIYFYGSDPRPLLLCYGEKAYNPKKPKDPIPEMQVIMDYTKWTRVTNITECTCLDPNLSDNDDNILNTLLEVVCFLNPVQLNPKQIPDGACRTITPELPKPPGAKSAEYNLHEYKASSYVKMKITRTDVKCYEQYTYEPHGTSGGKNGNGFRLGSVHYCDSKYSNKFNRLEYNTLTSQYRHYPLVKATVYYYDHDKQFKEPLLIELEFNTNGGVVPPPNPKEYYKLESLIDKEGTGTKWKLDSTAEKQIGVGSEHNQKLVSYLDKIRFNFKNVLQVFIAIKKSQKYKANLFDTKGQPSDPEQTIQVNVTEESNCQTLSNTGFRCFKHAISSLNSNELHKIGALEFFIPDQQGDQVKLNLYDTERSGVGPIQTLYYNCGMGDIYVYFYGGESGQYDGDPRPLLLCYNRHSYKPESKNSYFKKWIKDIQIISCECNKVDDKLLSALVNVSNFLNPVYINNRVKGIYRVHTFNGKHISIKLASKPSEGNFCYHKYVHSPNGLQKDTKDPQSGKGFRLGNIEYSGNCIKEFNDHQLNGDQTSGTCITSVLDDPPKKYIPALEVVVYYYRGDKNYNNPLLVALCKKDNDDAMNGVGSPASNCKCQPYYELQRDRTKDNNRRMYTKQAKPISLDDHKGGQLEKTLDTILFNISKRLQIILGKRPEPIKLCPSKRRRFKSKTAPKPCHTPNEIELGYQLLSDIVFDAAEMAQSILIQDSLFHKETDSSAEKIFKNCEKRLDNESNPKITTRIPTYTSKVYGSDGKRETGDSGSTKIKVKEIEFKALSDKGYRCYQHKIATIKNVEQIGGLRLFLWDNRTSDEKDTSLDDCKVTKPTNDTKKNCCEIDLYGDCTQISVGSSTNGKIDPIAYTTCKGDLYVYFYGSDPRPLLLCYNGEAYKPENMKRYIIISLSIFN